jgi:hypothetical protein
MQFKSGAEFSLRLSIYLFLLQELEYHFNLSYGVQDQENSFY